jgi:uncharacterized protein YndB with AHSA1/START domain
VALTWEEDAQANHFDRRTDMSRVTATASIDVAKPAEQVFAALADVRRHAEWSPRPYRIAELPEGTPVVQGTRYASYGWLPNDKDHRNDVEVTQLEAPTRLVLTATDGGEKFINTFTVTPTSSGSHIERAADMPKPGGVVGLVFPILLKVLVEPDMRKGLGTFKAILESS